MKWKVIGAVALFAALVATFIAVSGSGPDAAWKKAKLANTIAAYDQFCAHYPESPHVEEASKHLAELHEVSDWEAAKTKGTMDALDGFLVAYRTTGFPNQCAPISEGFGIFEADMKPILLNGKLHAKIKCP